MLNADRQTRRTPWCACPVFGIRHPALTGALAAALLLTAAAARAQPPSSDDIGEVRKDARVHAGPLYLTPTLELREIGVDGNVFNEAGDQKSDFMFNVAPRVHLWVPAARRALLTTSAAAELVWYREYASERSVNPQVSARLDVFLRRLTLFVEDAYLNTRQRPNYEIDVRSRHLENNAAAGAGLRLTPKFSVQVAGRRFDTEYDADDVFDGTSLQRTLNRKTSGVEVEAGHSLTPLTRIVLRADSLADRFAYSPGRDADSYRIMPGVEFRPRAVIKGSAFAGYRRFTPVDEAALPGFSGLVASLGLSYTLLDATTFGVTFRRDLTYSYEEMQPFFVDTAAGVSIRRALGRRFDVIVSGDRHHYAYEDIAPGSPGNPDRVDITWNYAASLGYRVRRDGRIGFGASYWRRESTTERFREYDNLRIGATATYEF